MLDFASIFSTNILRKKLDDKKAHVYRVRYVSGAMIDPDAGEAGTVTFDLKYLQDAYVKANDIMEAQSVFASKCMLTPHVYVHEIKQIDISTLN